MAVTSNAISRRQFIARSVAALAGTMVVPKLFGASVAPDPHRFALLADTHANAPYNASLKSIGGLWDNNLKRVVGQITSIWPLPMAAFVVGDLAFNTGECPDYERFNKLFEPIRSAGIPVHLAMGNHDHRGRFWEMFPPAETPVPNRHVAVVPTERANFFILDSLDGEVGKVQLQWLADALDANPDLPAITMVHHYPEEPGKPWGALGLLDTPALFDVILPRKQVKAHFFGHSHHWNIGSRAGVHLINLPTTVWDGITGWVDMLLDHGSARLQFNTLDPHPEIRKQVTLRWR